MSTSMTGLGRARAVAQGLITRPYVTPAEAVASFGAMQGQDLPGVMASVALRVADGNVAAVIADLDAGRIVRGYPMRGTVFLTPAADLLWMSELCNPAALKAARKRRSGLGLEDAMVERARERAQEILHDAPRGIPRAELFAAWEAVGTPTDHGRGYHVLAHLIGEGELCYGPWNGADQNIVSTRRWLPADSTLDGRFGGDRVAATAELLRRYVRTHGPCTLRDFAWWTKLPLREIRAAWTSIAADFEASDDPEPLLRRPGLDDEVAALGRAVARPLLLPGFDEFVLGYADRLFALTSEQHALLVPGNNGMFKRSIVVDGTIRGLWKRAGSPGRRRLELEPFAPLPTRLETQLRKEFERFPFVGA